MSILHRLVFGPAALLFVALSPQPAIAAGAADPVALSFSGRSFRFTLPKGYCPLGDSPEERALMSTTRQVVAKSSNQLLLLAYPCPELAEMKAGKRMTFDHMLQLQVIHGNQPGFQPLKISRAAFLEGIAKGMDQVKQSDNDSLQKQANNALQDTKLSVTGIQLTPIGRDAQAVYLSLRQQLHADQVTVSMSSVVAITLVRGLPLSIGVSENSGKAGDKKNLFLLTQEALRPLLADNP